ncbi:hypothetical protein A7U60_g2081 [Sanghuangporus baumii]|uniref:Uncharacterized protein n=1 Tax=Sanghuangporus baumii TaxID=108892 RepID=A0A9Q5NB58_SANBA|nr:hypothetical protein A7U60_g2081 [Sanghuangporus baumii]
MIPMDDTAPVSSRTRGRTDEGRATGSRSSSTDSDASAVRFELFRQDYGLNDYAQHNLSSSHSQLDYSEDEYATSVSQLSAAEDAPVIRPPIGFQFGQNQTQGLFGFGTFSQLGPNHANGFYAPSEQPSGSLPSSGLSLPSKVYENDAAAAFGPLTEQSTIAAQESVTGWNGFNIPGQPSYDMFGLGTGSQNGNDTNMFAHNAMQKATSTFPLNEVPSFQGNLLEAHHQASLEHIQSAAGEAVPQHTSQNANDALTSASHPVSTTDDGSSPDYRAIVESFFASVSDAYSEAENLPDSSAPPPQPEPESTGDRTEIVPEATPTLRRTVSNESYEPSSGPTSDDDTSSDGSFSSQKKRDNRTEQANGGAKNDEQRKRGMFRVRTSPASPSSQSERPVSTLPKQPLFSASGPVSSTETPSPYFEYKQRKESSREATSANGVQRDSEPSKTTTPVNSGSTTTGTQTRESSCEPSSVNLSISEASPSRDEPQPTATQNNAGHPRLPSQILPSAISYASSSAPSPSSQSVGGTPFQGPSLKMHYESEAILAERETPPENHLVSVMIADKRFPNTEPILVELILPLSPSGKSDYWLDTMFFCHSLQSGPSRIDGPAKAFVFRGRFRQYFLRVSEQNIDNYASGNIVVPYNRFLNVTVESTVPQVPPVGQTTSRPAPAPVQPLVPSSYANLTHVASPNPSEASLPSAPVTRSVQPPKRSREHSPPSSAPASAASTSATPSSGQQSSTSNQEPPRKYYYRKRAL